MSDVWKTLEERLKEKAKTTNEILAYIHDLQEFVNSKLVNAKVLINKGKEEWVRLEDAKEAIQQLRQKYILIPKRRLNQLFKLIADDVHPLKMRRFVEELLKT